MKFTNLLVRYKHIKHKSSYSVNAESLDSLKQVIKNHVQRRTKVARKHFDVRHMAVAVSDDGLTRLPLGALGCA